MKQAVGRILRETKGKKNDPIILDIRDKWGLLPSMYYKRRKMYRESGFELDKNKEEVEEPTLKGFAFSIS